MFNKKNNNKGFTLMEMLIVVAIIAILIAIAIPTFSSQLEKARESTDIANIRAAYSEAQVIYLDPSTEDFPVEVDSQPMTQAKSGWDNITWPSYLGSELDVSTTDVVTVSIAEDGTVTCSIKA